jgi:DNA-binding response OmpR family regulator
VNRTIASDRSVMLILNVRRLNKNVKVFVLADKCLLEDKVRMMEYGADESSTKPISMESLINKANLNLLEAARSGVAS